MVYILASNIESVLTVNEAFGIRSVWENSDDFLWESNELPLSQRLQLADRFGRESVFNRLLTLLRGNEDVKDIVAMQFSIGAVRKVFATIAALNFDVKWEHVFV
ncbi:hypothetical protein AAVH_38891 [Aphelenchoides avenae]|nr:hypothetical protein AAVH_38891 [Aphelenchus avenae]